MLFIIGLLLIRMLFFVNSLYYSISLLLVVLLILSELVSRLILSSLTMLILVIVYAGAIMILIGYICAVCPNLILRSLNFNYQPFVCFRLYYFSLKVLQSSQTRVDIFLPLSEYFYSLSGSLIFFLVIFMLFITLLIVTSQYITPKGPFRSITIQLVLVFICIVFIIFLINSNNLLLSLLLLEIIGFFIVYYRSLRLSIFLDFDFFILILFSIFVIEGVVALSGLILVVSFSGSDYIRSSSVQKL